MIYAAKVGNFGKILHSLADINETKYYSVGWLGSRVVSVLDAGAEGPGSNRSRDAVG